MNKHAHSENEVGSVVPNLTRQHPCQISLSVDSLTTAGDQCVCGIVCICLCVDVHTVYMIQRSHVPI